MKDICFTTIEDIDYQTSNPTNLNNPFNNYTPEICKIIADLLKDYILQNQDKWGHKFGNHLDIKEEGKGKMFGVLVVKSSKGELGYLCAYSGKLTNDYHPEIFVPSVFDIETENNFISKGMIYLSELSTKIKALDLVKNKVEIENIKTLRRETSIQLQSKLFSHYKFLNQSKESKKMTDIFNQFGSSRIAAGSGECAAPKLLNHAYKMNYTPIAISEFWWGKSTKSGDRLQGEFYPACEDKCRPILTYMLSLNK